MEGRNTQKEKVAGSKISGYGWTGPYNNRIIQVLKFSFKIATCYLQSRNVYPDDKIIYLFIPCLEKHIQSEARITVAYIPLISRVRGSYGKLWTEFFPSFL